MSENIGGLGGQPSPTVMDDLGKREPIPQNIPFANMLSYGPNGSPTITMTKTLYAASEITSTRLDLSTSTAGNEGTTNSLSILQDASPFVGVVRQSSTLESTPANLTTEETSTITGTSTIYNTITVTSTSTSTETVHDGSLSTNLGSSVESHIDSSSTASPSISSTETTSSNAPSAVASELPTHQNQGGTIAGATLGSMAAFGMIGFLIWYICVKKQGKRKLKAKITVKRRRSSAVKMPQLEDQSMEETRRTMLEQQKSLNDFLKTASMPSNENCATVIARNVSPKSDTPQTQRAGIHPAWIGMAVTSSTPPNTPPLPRSHSQKSTKTIGSVAASVGHPSSLMPGFGSQHQPGSRSLMPAPLKPALRPAPILTGPTLGRPAQVSPLSPRGMFSAVSNTTTRAWQRASQALSPGAYQRVAEDGQSSFEVTKRRDSKPRNPELEIGHQSDKEWNGQWI